jgi:ABC-type glutathione transport system ATPase component
MGPPVLAVRDFSVDLFEGGEYRPILSSVSFDVPARSIIGIFGDSGCGKTTLALGMVGLLPARRYRVRGSVLLDRQEIVGLRERDLRAIRGAKIAMVQQDPALALNPVMRVRNQIAEGARAHRLPAAPDELLRKVGLEDAGRIAASYPHQLSGGQRQRVTIAQALVCGPAVVIADEPFTALDASSALAMTDLLLELKRTTGTSFVVISHSAGTLARIADTVVRIESGRVAEAGTPEAVFRMGSGNRV